MKQIPIYSQTPQHASLQHQIHAIKQRLHKPGAQPQLHKRLQNDKAKQYYRDQRKSVTTPFSATADTAVANARNTYQQTQSALAGQEAQTKQEYGFEDQTNPFALAKLLETNYAQKKAGTLNSYAASGQLYSGSTQNALTADQSSHDQSLDSLARNYQAALAKISNSRAEAKNTEVGAIRDARAKAIEDAVNNPIDPSAAPAPPKFAKAFAHRKMAHAAKLAKHGKKNRAEKLRERIANLIP